MQGEYNFCLFLILSHCTGSHSGDWALYFFRYSLLGSLPIPSFSFSKIFWGSGLNARNFWGLALFMGSKGLLRGFSLKTRVFIWGSSFESQETEELKVPKWRVVLSLGLYGLLVENGEKIEREFDIIFPLLSFFSKNLTALLTIGNSEGVDSLLKIDSKLTFLLLILNRFWVLHLFRALTSLCLIMIFLLPCLFFLKILLLLLFKTFSSWYWLILSQSLRSPWELLRAKWELLQSSLNNILGWIALTST